MAQEVSSFDQFKLNRQLLNAIAEVPYEEPTPIQKKAIPLILAGHDLIGVAQTGTGKTAAFVLPLLMKIKYAQGEIPRALILAPTRELVMQIEDQVKLFATYTDIRFLSLYGGLGPKTQIEKLKKGIDLIVATPGRFLDLYLKGEIKTKMIKSMVLDEADKMMDMGFLPQIKRILEVLPTKRQNMLFSATMPPKVVELTHDFLEFPEKVAVSLQATPAETVEQSLYRTPNFLTKINLLQHLLTHDSSITKLLIFTRTKENADNVYKFIHRKLNQEVQVIHANKGQNTRINAMEAFRSDAIKILVSTDVAARGIDVSQVTHVINFDVPVVYEDYVHRIGRTGRASLSGKAITFVNEVEELHIKRIEKIIRQKIPFRELPKEVKIEKTPFKEQQLIDREIDHLKRKDNPDFKGAFHDKKLKPNSKPKKKGNSKSGKRRR